MPQIVMLSLDEKTLITELDRAGYKKMGVLVRSATTFEDAIRILKNDAIDIIVMNMDHSSVNTAEATVKIKRVKEWSSIPIVLTSVQSSAKIKQTAVKCGADLFVEQPLPRDYFIEKLKSILEQETRATQRVQGSVGLTFIWNGSSHSCDVADLSITGLLASTNLSIPPGERVEMQINLGASSKLVRAVGEIVRHVKTSKVQDGVSSSGIGIRFISFKGDARERIESWVARTSDSSNKMAYYL
jgi:CheY-like chemotaxis protein